MIKEFKEFALKGNMMDLAIGMIIGAAFTAIVNALVDDLINPIIGIFTGGIDFSNLFIALDGGDYATLAAAEEAGGNVLKLGSFISAIINFLILALVVFFIMKAFNKARAAAEKPAEEEEAAPETMECPFCKTEIKIGATRCPNCTSVIEPLVTADLEVGSEA